MALGRKTGGRTKGTPNKLTPAAKELAAKLGAEGGTPLDVMLQCMHLAAKEGRFITAVNIAAKAAPYVHPKLSAVELDLKDFTDEHLRDLAR